MPSRKSLQGMYRDCKNVSKIVQDNTQGAHYGNLSNVFHRNSSKNTCSGFPGRPSKVPPGITVMDTSREFYQECFQGFSKKFLNKIQHFSLENCFRNSSFFSMISKNSFLEEILGEIPAVFLEVFSRATS